MADVVLGKIDETTMTVTAEASTLASLCDAFALHPPSYKHHPLYKRRVWDGRIHHIKSIGGQGITYIGLANRVSEWCRTNNISCEVQWKDEKNSLSILDIKNFISTLGLPFEPHQHQTETIAHAIQNNRAVLVSPTASGKSLIAYTLTRFYNLPTLIVVPRTSLVRQMAKHFREYGFTGDIQEIADGAARDIHAPIVISTWQSVYKQPEVWYRNFQLIIGDEAHQFAAKSLIRVMTNLKRCRYRFGLTGSLDGNPSNECLIEGLFGPPHKIVTTAELMRRGVVSELKIEVIVLGYSRETIEGLWMGRRSPPEWFDERAFIASHEDRRRFIADLTVSRPGCSLALFELVKDDGEPLYTEMRRLTENTDRSVYLIHGGVPTADRETIRRLIEKDDQISIAASYGTYSTGIDIPTLRSVVFAGPIGKSKVRIPQSIGRSIRRHETKDQAVVFDVVDDLSHGNRLSHGMRHIRQRLKMYAAEEFNVRIRRIELEE